MSLQNRVDPWGRLIATPERGTMMGNRGGKFHRPDQTLGKRRWASTHWICCDLHWKDQHHEPMGQGYTSLFFLDEVTALAAGHRPCFYCRRKEAKAFLGERRVTEFDLQLHAERIQKSLSLRCEAKPSLEGRASGDASRLLSVAPQHEGLGGVPDGAMVEYSGDAYAVHRNKLLLWSFSGYTASISYHSLKNLKVLTPPSIIAILQTGYKPRWHESAKQWD
jgi:hypothetical protein